MRFSLWVAFGLCLASLFSGCPTTQEVWTKVNTLAAVVFRNLSVGAYRATPQQIRVADQRATAVYKGFSPREKTLFKESGTRYLAVRTSNPTPAQMVEIRKNMQKPGSLYAKPTSAPDKVYCIMIWDTQAQEIVGTDCYAVLSLPKPGTVARFDTYTAQYMGTF
jgi:hypothetical protein